MSGTRSEVTDTGESTPDEAASFAYCTRVAREHGRNFYYGMKLMPQPRRDAMYAVYAWMRAADDLADEPGEATAKAGMLDAFRQQTDAALDPGAAVPSDGPSPHAAMWPAVAATFRSYRIQGRHLHDMIDGQLRDQTQLRYADFPALENYCYHVAGTVGLVCLSVWGAADDEVARKLAVTRGLSLQLTNILRDLVEDANRNRLYLPADELRQHGLDDVILLRMLTTGQTDARFDALMKQQIVRARDCYIASATLESHLDADCRPTCWAMMRIYEQLLEKIATDPRRVIRQRVSLSTPAKLGIGLRAMMGRTGGTASGGGGA